MPRWLHMSSKGIVTDNGIYLRVMPLISGKYKTIMTMIGSTVAFMVHLWEVSPTERSFHRV